MPAIPRVQDRAHHAPPRWLHSLQASLARDRELRPRPPVTLAKLDLPETDDAIADLLSYLRRADHARAQR
jgi:hypothetical protein